MKPSRNTIQVIPYMLADGPRKTYSVSLEQAEIMVARGAARWTNDGTRTIRETKVSVRGESRSWRKVTNRTKNGAALYSTMQLVPGVSQGRNTGARHGHKY
jgi:primase-polymerase (primpol)-like protein